MIFRQLFDSESSTYTYILGDESSREAIIIDPVLEKVSRDLQLLMELELSLKYILDTHVHADHVTGAAKLREATGAQVGLSSQAGTTCADLLLQDGQKIPFGRHSLEVRHTPGHTAGCVTYAMPGMIFTGDTLLVRAAGRTDFQGGSAEMLYQSIQKKIFSLPDETLIFPGHDYQGRTCTSVGEEKKYNIRIGDGKTLEEFVQIMNGLGLPKPKKIDVAVPANLNCGQI